MLMFDDLSAHAQASVALWPTLCRYYPLSLWKWQMFEQMEQSWESQKKMGTGGGDGETEVLKNMLLETSPALLATTFVVSILHMVFDMLAFKNGKSPLGCRSNATDFRCHPLQGPTRAQKIHRSAHLFKFCFSWADISFWKNKKSMEGLSVSGVFLSSFSSLIIFLCKCQSLTVSLVSICDCNPVPFSLSQTTHHPLLLPMETADLCNSDEISKIVLFSSGLGCCIEFWKIQKGKPHRCVMNTTPAPAPRSRAPDRPCSHRCCVVVWWPTLGG